MKSLYLELNKNNKVDHFIIIYHMKNECVFFHFVQIASISVRSSLIRIVCEYFPLTKYMKQKKYK